MKRLRNSLVAVLLAFATVGIGAATPPPVVQAGSSCYWPRVQKSGNYYT